MKYFKNINIENQEKRNDSELWGKVVKLFVREKDCKQQMTTTLEELASNRRNFEYHKNKEEYEREYTHQNPRLEDNSNDTNY